MDIDKIKLSICFYWKKKKFCFCREIDSFDHFPNLLEEFKIDSSCILNILYENENNGKKIVNKFFLY